MPINFNVEFGARKRKEQQNLALDAVAGRLGINIPSDITDPTAKQKYLQGVAPSILKNREQLSQFGPVEKKLDAQTKQVDDLVKKKRLADINTTITKTQGGSDTFYRDNINKSLEGQGLPRLRLQAKMSEARRAYSGVLKAIEDNGAEASRGLINDFTSSYLNVEALQPQLADIKSKVAEKKQQTALEGASLLDMNHLMSPKATPQEQIDAAGIWLAAGRPGVAQTLRQLAGSVATGSKGRELEFDKTVISTRNTIDDNARALVKQELLLKFEGAGGEFDPENPLTSLMAMAKKVDPEAHGFFLKRLTEERERGLQGLSPELTKKIRAGFLPMEQQLELDELYSSDQVLAGMIDQARGEGYNDEDILAIVKKKKNVNP